MSKDSMMTTSRASLCTLGEYLKRHCFFAPLREQVQIPQKTVRYRPIDKVLDGLLGILCGAKTMSQSNVTIRVDPAVQRAFGRTGCAEQATIARTLQASTAETVTELARDAERLRQSVRQEQGIVKDGVFNLLETVPVQVKPAGGVSSLPIPFIGTAYAQSNSSAPEGVRFGVRVEQPRYVVVLKKSGSAEQAVQDAQRLRESIPAARAVRSDKGYFVVLGSTPAGETEALLAAAHAKKAANDAVQPVLVEVK